MKISVLNSDGVQTSKDGKIRYYYLVEDTYDFSGNSSTNVTDILNLKLLYSIFRFGYSEYRDSLITYAQTITFGDLTGKEQFELSKNFAVNKADRDSVISVDDQKDYAKDVQGLIDESNKQDSFESSSPSIVNEVGVPDFTDSTFSTLFGSYVAEVSSELETSTVSKDFQTKLSLITTDIPSGKYKISWSFEQRGVVNFNLISTIQLDGSTTLMENNIEFKDKDNWVSASGFKYENITSGVHTIDFKFKSESNNNIGIRKLRIDIWRIS